MQFGRFWPPRRVIWALPTGNLGKIWNFKHFLKNCHFFNCRIFFPKCPVSNFKNMAIKSWNYATGSLKLGHESTFLCRTSCHWQAETETFARKIILSKTKEWKFDSWPYSLNAAVEEYRILFMLQSIYFSENGILVEQHRSRSADVVVASNSPFAPKGGGIRDRYSKGWSVDGIWETHGLNYWKPFAGCWNCDFGGCSLKYHACVWNDTCIFFVAVM